MVLEKQSSVGGLWTEQGKAQHRTAIGHGEVKKTATVRSSFVGHILQLFKPYLSTIFLEKSVDLTLNHV